MIVNSHSAGHPVSTTDRLRQQHESDGNNEDRHQNMLLVRLEQMQPTISTALRSQPGAGTVFRSLRISVTQNSCGIFRHLRKQRMRSEKDNFDIRHVVVCETLFQLIQNPGVCPAVNESVIIPDVCPVDLRTVQFDHFQQMVLEVAVDTHFSCPQLTAKQFLHRPDIVEAEVIYGIYEFSLRHLLL